MKDKIFVQIASYRDPELLPTIKDALDKAQHPENLRFGICWQHSSEDEWDTLDEFNSDDRFRIIDIASKHSKGACWARSLTQLLYKDETFTLQIDSHTRFVKNWDQKLIDLFLSLNDDKALLTGYPPNYSPNSSESTWYSVPQICNVYGFDGKYVLIRPMDIPDYKTKSSPRRGIFISAGFFFGKSDIIKDVPYDPDLYFSGEELSLTLRFFTHGYNLYHPHELIMHHYYSRPSNIKHWGDHEDWGRYSITAEKRLDALLGYNDINLKMYGLGSKRTIEDYKIYAGVDFTNKIVHEYTEKGGEPPHEYDEDGWNNIKGTYSEILNWDYNLIDTADDITFWAFIIKDQHDIAIYRWDALTSKDTNIINGKTTSRKFEFEHNIKKQIPTKLLIWPYSASKGWINSSHFNI
jgi:hypothetical protein